MESLKSSTVTTNPNPMNTTKNHAPGPWAIRTNHIGVATIDGTRENPIGSVCQLTYRSEMDANARLIAASPDLLAACEHAANVFRAEIKDIDPRNELSRNDTPELAAAWHNLETMEKALTKSRTL